MGHAEHYFTKFISISASLWGIFYLYQKVYLYVWNYLYLPVFRCF